MKLKNYYYQFIMEQFLLRLIILQMDGFQTQNHDSIISMAKVKHTVFNRRDIREVICEYQNHFLPEDKRIVPEQLLTSVAQSTK